MRHLSLRNIILLSAGVIAISIAYDIIHLSAAEHFPAWPPPGIKYQQDQVYADLVNGHEIDWTRLEATIQNPDDFRTQSLLRIIFEFGSSIPDSVRQKIDKALLGFRYWWDEPGGNSMCYWSENHQILFNSTEYLAGQLYPDNVFTNSGLKGTEHKANAGKRIMAWLEMRWEYGFTEFYSNVYYKEDIAALINLIDYADDDEIVKKSEIILDLLMFDVASQSIGNVFTSASGRAYEHNRKGGLDNNLDGATEYFWGAGSKIGPGMTYGMMTSKKYRMPGVLKAIAGDTNNLVIRQRNGLDLSELKDHGFTGTGDRSMMMQLGMESFTNPGIVQNTLSFVRKNRMFSNETLKDLAILDLTIIRFLHLAPVLTKIINPPSDGVAIQQGNTYTYKTKDYSLYTVQKYHPGTYGDQQHVAGMNVGRYFSIFHTHPATSKTSGRKSPNYWVGYGRLPHAVQDSSVSLAIYCLPERKNIMEKELPAFTHAYFPEKKFDSIYVINNYAFGRKGNTYCAFICMNNLIYEDQDHEDLVQKGRRVFWITEAGSKEKDSSFNQFCKRIKNNVLSFDSRDLELSYFSHGREYRLKYKGDFYVDGNRINTSYDRFDSPYCKASEASEALDIRYNGQSLHLDFNDSVIDSKP